MTEDRLDALLRAAVPAAPEGPPARDLWGDLATRLDEAPRWSVFDLGLAAAAIVTLLLNPEWIWLLAYHL